MRWKRQGEQINNQRDEHHMSSRTRANPAAESVIWSTYSLLDPSYSSQTSFGFWIDTGGDGPPLLSLKLAVMLAFHQLSR